MLNSVVQQHRDSTSEKPRSTDILTQNLTFLTKKSDNGEWLLLSPPEGSGFPQPNYSMKMKQNQEIA